MFDQANEGAQEAAGGARRDPSPTSSGPADNSVAGQIEFMTNAATQGVDAVMLSNNAGEQIVRPSPPPPTPASRSSRWDSPIPSGEGESVFVAQVDFDETGQVMADMAPSTSWATTAASSRSCRRRRTPPTRTPGSRPWRRRSQDPKYANLELVETVYGNDERRSRTTRRWPSSTSTPTWS